jgi:amidase
MNVASRMGDIFVDFARSGDLLSNEGRSRSRKNKEKMIVDIVESDTIGAFCKHDSIHLAGAGDGPLAGLTFAAKDIFEIAGRVPCCGNPDWLTTHDVPTKTAPVVQMLLDAGATLVGTTITTELVMGLTGENEHYGTPINVAAPGRVPGGSSAGSAAAVAAGLVDFALGSDTGGSVRTPASFCGIFGFRPTHGRLPMEGVMPFALSLDAVGWFARDGALLERAGRVLLSTPKNHVAPKPTKLLVATDALDVVDPEIRSALMPQVERLAAKIGSSENVQMADGEDLENWSKTIAVFREREGWDTHRDWIERFHPRLQEQNLMRMKLGQNVTDDDVARAKVKRDAIRKRMESLLGGGAVLAVPAGPGVAPPRATGNEATWRLVGKNGRINSVSPLVGLPQVSLPLAKVDGLPMGVGLMAWRGNDEMLLEIARGLSPA